MIRAWTSFILVTFTTLTALADNPVCVRDYKISEGIYACDRSSAGYNWVFPENRSIAKVCTRTYKSSFCQTSPKQYIKVPATDGSVVCVMNFNQPPTNLCDTIPANYQYILHRVP